MIKITENGREGKRNVNSPDSSKILFLIQQSVCCFRLHGMIFCGQQQKEDKIMIGEQIASFRKQKGLTQEQLGDMLGVSNRTVSKWEAGASLPGADMIPDIAAALGVSLDALFGVQTAPDQENLTDLVRETIRSELTKILPRAVQEAVGHLSGGSTPARRQLTVVCKDGHGVRSINMAGEAFLNGPETYAGVPDRWLVNVKEPEGETVTVGDYDSREEAEEVLKAIRDAYSGRYAVIEL